MDEFIHECFKNEFLLPNCYMELNILTAHNHVKKSIFKSKYVYKVRIYFHHLYVYVFNLSAFYDGDSLQGRTVCLVFI